MVDGQGCKRPVHNFQNAARSCVFKLYFASHARFGTRLTSALSCPLNLCFRSKYEARRSKYEETRGDGQRDMDDPARAQ